MDKKEITLLFDYSTWADTRLLQAAAGLSPEQFTRPVEALPRLSHKTLRDTLVHALGAQWIWRNRCQGLSPTALLSPEEFPALEELVTRWEKEAGEMQRFLASLSDDDLDRTIHYTSTRGKPFENTLWHILLHVANHSTQHRSEAAVLLTEWGCSPGDLDLILFLRG